MNPDTLLLTTLWSAVIISLGGLVMTIINLRVFRPAGPPAAATDAGHDAELVSVCVPARNEEANLEACVRGLLASGHRALEVLVYDDASDDATPRILTTLAAADPRVRAAPTRPLPAGWNGKQHACWRMAAVARGRWLLFTDADVRFAPDCIGRAVAEAGRLNAPLLSTFPRQEMGTFGERLLVPMIFFILLSYLPFPRMRRTNDASASAGCGQFLLVRRDAYDASGGHERFKDSMHDGIKLPRAVRRAGFHSDLFDGTDLVSCRMYKGLGATWRGFAKNAFEGLGSVPLLLFITILHLVGHVWPWVYLPLVAASALGLPVDAALSPVPLALAAASIVLQLTSRLLIARRVHHPIAPIALHPVSVLGMTLVQWHSLYLSLTGRRSWRGRRLEADLPAPGGAVG